MSTQEHKLGTHIYTQKNVLTRESMRRVRKMVVVPLTTWSWGDGIDSFVNEGLWKVNGYVGLQSCFMRSSLFSLYKYACERLYLVYDY